MPRMADAADRCRQRISTAFSPSKACRVGIITDPALRVTTWQKLLEKQRRITTTWQASAALRGLDHFRKMAGRHAFGNVQRVINGQLVMVTSETARVAQYVQVISPKQKMITLHSQMNAVTPGLGQWFRIPAHQHIGVARTDMSGLLATAVFCEVPAVRSAPEKHPKLKPTI